MPNLDFFINFIAYYATGEQVSELVQLPVVYHRGFWDAIVFCVSVGVMVKDRWVGLPERECELAGCPRCEVGRQGYSIY